MDGKIASTGTTTKVKQEDNADNCIEDVTAVKDVYGTAAAVAIKQENETNESRSRSPSDDDALTIPDEPLSHADIVGSVFETLHQDVKVKKEGSASILSDEDRSKKKKAFDAWVKANTDPETKQGRYVFRRACHKSCISTILSGGMEPWPVVMNPPMINDRINPFIKPGEFFVAGNEAWNPFGPRFPGDSGLVDKSAFEQNPDQTEFHLFVQCSKHPSKRHWHGKLAEKGRMYCGVYRIPEDDDPVMEIEYAKETSFDLESRKVIADFHVRKHYKRHEGNLGPEVDDFVESHPLAAQKLAGDDWTSCSQYKKHIWIMVAYLCHTKHKFEFAPVQFVRFDEALYQTLVQYDCANTNYGVRGRVSLDSAELYQFF
jgi:hypothetical protein